MIAVNVSFSLRIHASVEITPSINKERIQAGHDLAMGGLDNLSYVNKALHYVPVLLTIFVLNLIGPPSCSRLIPLLNVLP